MTRVLDGREIAREIERIQRERVAVLPRPPGLCVLLFGDDSPSQVYARMIERGCERVGIRFRRMVFERSTSFREARAAVEELNRDGAVDGILIKRPLPGPLSDESLLQVTSPAKDVDGYHFQNVGRLTVEGPGRAPVPCTPAGVLELLWRTGHSPEGRHVVILGRSATVGKPLAALLGHKREGLNATVTLCHQSTRDLTSHTRRADILITAVGSPRFVTRDMVRPDAVVIDVGTNAVADPESPRGYRLVGDADFDALLGHCAAVTRVPGGVGPVTVAMLLRNVVDAADRGLESP